MRIPKKTVRLKISYNIFDALINLICLLVFVSSYFNTIYMRTTDDIIYLRLFSYSIYIIVILSSIALLLVLFKQKKVQPIVIIMMLLFLYEVTISWAFNMLSFQEIVRDNLVWILTFCVFYSYGYIKNTETNSNLVQIINLGTIIYCFLIIPNIRMHIQGMDPRGGIIGPLYYSLGFLGLILLYSSKKLKTFFSVIIGIMILMSTKRTGLFIIVIGLSCYYVGQASVEKRLQDRVKKYVCLIVFAILALLIAFWVIEKYDVRIIERLYSISTDGGSGRDIIWTKVINYFSNSSNLHKIMGYGYHAVPVLIHPWGRALFAHNGFLEVLFDFGYIGLTFMIGGILWLVLSTLKMLKVKFQYAPSMSYSIVVIILLSLFGYFFEESRFIMPVAMLTGVCLGAYKKRCNEYKR